MGINVFSIECLKDRIHKGRVRVRMRLWVGVRGGEGG